MALNINIQEILNVLSYQFNLLLTQKDYGIEHIVVGNERYFVENPLKEKELGIVFSLGSGLVDFDQAVLPFDLIVLGQNEQMEMTQTLLYDYSIKYCNITAQGYYQRYSTPRLDEEFVEYAEDIRTLWSISGTIRFADTNSANTTLRWLNKDGEEEIIETLEINFVFHNEPSPQPMSDTYGENITINRINTFTLNFSVYAKSNSFYQEILADQLAVGKKNTRYDMILNFGNGLIYNVGLVVVDINGKQAVGENGIITITMAR